MAKVSKEFTWRMEGMNYALAVVKRQGVDALETDIRQRGFLGMPINYTMQDAHEFHQNLMATTMTVWAYTLNSTFGFGKKRLELLRDAFQENTNNMMDFDYLGNHYATLGDYAAYLNEKYDYGLDEERVKRCQETSQNEKKNKDMAHMPSILKDLRDGGFTDAATYLQKKIM